MRTFLQLQNEALRKIGDEEDQDKMRDLIKEALNSVQRRVLLERRYSFMLHPETVTVSVEVDRKHYPLHPSFGQLWYAQNVQTGEFLEEIPTGELKAVGDNVLTGEIAYPDRFLLTAIQNVKQQPASAGTLTITTTGGTEAAANKIYVRGTNASDEWVEETLSSGSAWSTLTSTTSWKYVESISKLGGTFSRTITATIGSTTILTLLASEYGRQYRQLELTKFPTTTGTINYRFYRKPCKMTNDYDIPQIPAEFADILVYGALIDVQGFGRPSSDELKNWKDQYDSLVNQLQQQYQQARSMNKRGDYINHIPR